MDWDKAKNLTIVFFLLLNILLGVLVYWEENSYIISAEQEKAIVGVLAQNKINLYTRIDREYKPMRRMELGEYDFGGEDFVRQFFDRMEEVLLTEEHNRSVFTQGDAILSIQNEYVHYQNPQGIGKKTDAKPDAADICETWIKNLKMGSFQLEGISQEDGRHVLRYLNVYQGHVVQSNFINFVVTDQGIVEIDLSYRPPEGFSGRPQVICSADEALFTFMQQMKNMYGDRDVFINKMDMAFYVSETGQAAEGKPVAEPCYRIFVAGEPLPFLVHGYRNVML